MAAQADSFQFGGVDMLEAYGIRCLGHDFLLPKLRERKVVVPQRDGAYDLGARYYDERMLALACDSMRGLTRQELRELAYVLSRKSRLVLWDEPEKNYLGRIYDAAELEYVGRVGHSFQLTFVCDPFAYGRTVAEAMPTRMDYRGTAATPVRIQITNTGTAAIAGIRIRIRERSE